MKKITVIFLFTISACTVFKDTRKSQTDKISELTFRKYFEVSEEGKRNTDALQDSMIAKLKNEKGMDSTGLEMFSQFSMAELFKTIPEAEIHIQIIQDSIWRYETGGLGIVDYLYRIDRKQGILYTHDKKDKSILYNVVNLFEKGGEYSIKQYPNDRKTILGYDCFKVCIRKKSELGKGSPFETGDSIYEMYVTKKIDLPVHALLNFNKDFSDFFPLEVRTWGEKLAGNQEVYELVEIE